MSAGSGFARLVEVMAQLRAESGGCPWDREQTLASLRTYLIEESHELLDAIDALGEAGRALPAELPTTRPDPALVAQLREELDGLTLEIADTCEREVVEGTFHTGRAAVVRVLAVKA